MQEDFEIQKQKLRNAVSKAVKRLRLSQNKSISGISAEIMMTKSLWADLEKGKKDPQLSTVWRIAEALNIPIEKFISEIKKELDSDFTLID